jgi:hypothetical protein
MWITAHEDELRDLPDRSYKFRNVDISYETFKQAAGRGVVQKVGKDENVYVWEIDRQKLAEALDSEELVD